ncbi:phosphohistidine phosphatase [Mycobacterium sp. 852002-51971_SCH5477799-a]|uniref:GNAT family N-acetyltransferase n=1 Tax=Mycobacterium sp. 852002-51971_SCH5477799-a TaxID=1834106 RepID=UPI0007FDCEE9|nr:GNAT family N-acyltransferase [Mycobacterium sp. 852002-51971_SCH5477799-a]OBF67026.1 phosphohistidine phosphatase [Mycobacterium sp. 852002-51971_SCH5477799-a]
MSIASVLIPSEKPTGTATSSVAAPRYSLLLSTDPGMIEAAQRLRYDVFTSTPGFALPATDRDGRDPDRFDEFCDHLLVRDDDTGELVGCYRMLAPAGAIAAGGLYTATEFDIRALDPLRPSLVEMGRAVVRDGHRNGGVVLLMWAGILAYLDRYGYDYVTGCVSVPIGGEPDLPPGSQLRGVRDFILSRHGAPPEHRVYPHRPVVVDGKGIDDIAPPARPAVPALMRGYLRLGARVCGEPAHDPDFGVGDFCVLLGKAHADNRYLKRLRSVSVAAEMRSAGGRR